MKTLTVNLPDRDYPIIIARSLIDNAAEYLKQYIQGTKVIIVTDSNVAPLWLDPIENALMQLKKHYHVITIAAGETSKNIATFERCCDEALFWGIDRKTTFIALGGGVTGDLCGFMAASLLRGVPFIQVPTTLLAQVDSSVGGKTGINSQAGKNLIGAFWQPKLVLSDIDALTTLPMRDFKSGLAEVIKYALIHKPDFFLWFNENITQILNKEPEALAHIVYESCHSKAEIVASDETEQNRRALLNLGHTFGHVLEAFCGYNSAIITHGEAVAIGMQLAFDFSVSQGTCPASDAEKLQELLIKLDLPYSLKDFSAGKNWQEDQFIHMMKKDKKAVDNTITLVLAKAIGKAYIEQEVNIHQLEVFIKQNLG